MTSKRLGLFVFALAALWSLAGLDWFASPASETSYPVLSVNAAEAGMSDGHHTFGTKVIEGDPDEYANSPDGDPDEFGGSPDDSTATSSGDSGQSKNDSLLLKIISILHNLFPGRY